MSGQVCLGLNESLFLNNETLFAFSTAYNIKIHD